MKEELISFETAVLAKEKGFDLNTHFEAYALGDLFQKEPKSYKRGDLIDMILESESLFFIEEKVAYATTQSLLQKWLREERELQVYSHMESIGSDEWEYSYEICYLPKDKWNKKRRVPEFKHIRSFREYGGVYDGAWSTYEEALEKGLIEALKLI